MFRGRVVNVSALLRQHAADGESHVGLYQVCNIAASPTVL